MKRSAFCSNKSRARLTKKELRGPPPFLFCFRVPCCCCWRCLPHHQLSCSSSLSFLRLFPFPRCGRSGNRKSTGQWHPSFFFLLPQRRLLQSLGRRPCRTTHTNPLTKDVGDGGGGSSISSQIEAIAMMTHTKGNERARGAPGWWATSLTSNGWPGKYIPQTFHLPAESHALPIVTVYTVRSPLPFVPAAPSWSHLLPLLIGRPAYISINASFHLSLIALSLSSSAG